jgi:XTP/dITP diphosphohydrolase
VPRARASNSVDWLAADARIVVATSNAGKVREIRAILAQYTPALVVPVDASSVTLPDEGDDYQTNAIGKARAVAEQLHVIAIGDDSGLEVDALEGRPGVHSARYGGPDLDARGRVDLLLRELRGVPAGSRTARFVCHAALATPSGACVVARGECHGVILEAVRGERGFGYDPVFQLTGRRETMAELTEGEKNRASHRAAALGSLFGPDAARTR